MDHWAVRFFVAIVRSLIAIGVTAGVIVPSHASPDAPCLNPSPVAYAVQLASNETATPTRFTGLGTSSERFRANGDLGIPFFLADCSLGVIFGDTIEGPRPGLPDQGEKRTPVMLRSNSPPGQPYVFDSAAGLDGDGVAPALFPTEEGEYGPIPTDGIAFPETHDEIISFMSVNQWNQDGGPEWSTNYSGLAFSSDGNHFERLNIRWPNTLDNTDPFQMMSLQRSGKYVYAVSVRAGRQAGPMMLQRVPWDDLQTPSSWQCWAGGKAWVSTFLDPASCKPMLEGAIGEPSFRLFSDGTWALSYLKMDAPDGPSIVSRWATSPTGPWSPEKIQLPWSKNPREYGGYWDPRSDKEHAWMMVSTWDETRYDVSMLPVSLLPDTSYPSAPVGESNVALPSGAL